MRKLFSIVALIMLTSVSQASPSKMELAELKGLELGMGANEALIIFKRKYPHAVRQFDQVVADFYIYGVVQPFRQIMLCRDKVVGLHASEDGRVDLWARKIMEFIGRGATTISEAEAMNARGNTNIYSIKLMYPTVQDVTVTLTNIGPLRDTGDYSAGALLVKKHPCMTQ